MRCARVFLVLLVFAGAHDLKSQPPPAPQGSAQGRPAPPPPPPPDPARRMEEIRKRLAERPAPVGGARTDAAQVAEQRALVAFATQYLKEAEQAIQAGEQFKADRLIDAADACRRPLDHLRHIEEEQRAPTDRPAPPVPLAVHLRQVYFRLRLADVFLQEIRPKAPTRLLEIARAYYARALAAQRAKQDRMAEEYAAAANDLTHALEHLAQGSIAVTR